MRRSVRVAVRGVTALVSAAVLAAAGQLWALQRHVDNTVVTSSSAIIRPHPTPAGTAFNALLVGLDARTDANGNPLPQSLFDALHVGPDQGELHTDTIILLHVPANPDQPAVAISIPRDSYVPIAGDRGTHKINSAYARGLRDAEDQLKAQGVTGPALDRQGREAGRRALVQTVENLTGVTIDHYAEINMLGFVDLTDALGGVPVCLNHPVTDSYSGVDLPAGPQLVSGPQALAFVRQRHGLTDGDLDRIARQQAFAAGLARRLITAGTLTDPTALQRLVAIATKYVVVDSGWNLDQALSQVGRLSGADLTFRTIPTGRPDLRTPVDGIAVQIDRDAVRAFVQDLIADPQATAAPTRTPAPTGTSTPGTRHAASPTAPATARPAGTPRGTAAAPTRTGTATPTPTPTGPPQVITADGLTCVD